MAVSEYHQQLLKGLKSEEERRIIRRFYAMSRGEWLENYRRNMGGFINVFDRTRLWEHQKDNIRYRHDRLGQSTAPSGFITTLPAGSGKTEIIIETVMQNAIEVTENDQIKLITPPTVILVPSEDLVTQTYSELKERYPHLLIGMDYGRSHTIAPLTVSTYDTFIDKVNEGKINPKDVLNLVMDEGHRGLSEDRLAVFRRFLETSLIDAYSASPAFDVSKNLYALLGQESVIPGPTDRQLTDLGHLAECHNVLMRVKVNTKDIPPELLKDRARYEEFLEELKILSALEFYQTYEDPESKQRAFGKPAVGFTRYVKHAKRADELFRDGLAEYAATNEHAARLLQSYSHPTQVLSRSLGDKEVTAAFNRILPPNRRTANDGDNLITITTKMAREGTNIPRWKVALGFHTPNSSVEQIQSRGRVRRKTGDEISFVLDTFIEEDGAIRGKPKFYYEAIDDPSIVRGVVTVTPDTDRIKETANDVLEYKTKQEMQELVLGAHGTAKRRHEIAFGRLWDEAINHIEAQKKKQKPEPYILDDEPVPFKTIVHYKEDEEGTKTQGTKTETRISQKAVDQFRGALGIPGQMNGNWLDYSRLRDQVIGGNERADHYDGALSALTIQALRHYEKEKTHAHPKPLIVGGQPVRIQERLDENGNLRPAYHVEAVQAFKQQLDVVPNKGFRFLGRQEFEELVLTGVDNPAQYKQRLELIWDQAKSDYNKNRKPGLRCQVLIGGDKVEAATCFVNSSDISFVPKDKELTRSPSGGGLLFCLDRHAIAAARNALGLPKNNIGFDPKNIKWEKDITAVEQIRKLRDGEIYPTKTAEWLGKIEVARLLGTQPAGEFSVFFDSIEKEYDEKKEQGILDSQPIVRGGEGVQIIKSLSGSQIVYCYRQEQLSLFARLLDIALAEKGGIWKFRGDITIGRWVLPKNRAFFDDLEKEFLEKRRNDTLTQEPVIRNGTVIRMELCKAGNNDSIVGYHNDNIKDLIRLSGLALEVSEKTSEWLNRKEMAVLLGGRNNKTDKFFQDLEKEYKHKVRGGILELDPIQRSGKTLRVEQRASSKTSKPICYHKDDIEIIKEILGLKILPQKTGEWRNKKEAAKIIGVHSSLHMGFKQLWEAMELSSKSGTSVIIDGHVVNCQKMRSGPNTPFCTHQSEDDWLAEQVKLQKRSIAPDSPHIRNRSGRLRGGKE